MIIKTCSRISLMPTQFLFNDVEHRFKDIIESIVIFNETVFAYGVSNDIRKDMKECEKQYNKLRSYTDQIEACRKAGICTDLVVQYDNIIRTFKIIVDLFDVIKPYLTEKRKKSKKEPESTEQPDIDNPF